MKKIVRNACILFLAIFFLKIFYKKVNILIVIYIYIIIRNFYYITKDIYFILSLNRLYYIILIIKSKCLLKFNKNLKKFKN